MPQHIQKHAAAELARPEMEVLEYADEGYAKHRDAKHHLEADWRAKEPDHSLSDDRQAYAERLHELEEHVRLAERARAALAAASAAVAAYMQGWGYSHWEGLAEHKATPGHHLLEVAEGEEDVEDEEARLQELLAQVRAAESALKAYSDVFCGEGAWSYATEHGLAEHKANNGRHLEPYWRRGYCGLQKPKGQEEEEAALHDLEMRSRLGLVYRDAFVEGAWGYAEEGLAEHKANNGRHLEPYWRCGFEGLRKQQDAAEEADNLHDLEAHASLKEALAKAVTSLKLYQEAMGLAEEGFAAHKSAKRLDADWHAKIESEDHSGDKEAFADRLHELEAKVGLGATLKQKLAAAEAACQAVSDNSFTEGAWAYEYMTGLAQHRSGEGRLALWHAGFKGPKPTQELAERLHEVETKAPCCA